MRDKGSSCFVFVVRLLNRVPPFRGGNPPWIKPSFSSWNNEMCLDLRFVWGCIIYTHNFYCNLRAFFCMNISLSNVNKIFSLELKYYPTAPEGHYVSIYIMSYILMKKEKGVDVKYLDILLVYDYIYIFIRLYIYTHTHTYTYHDYICLCVYI